MCALFNTSVTLSLMDILTRPSCSAPGVILLRVVYRLRNRCIAVGEDSGL